LTAGPLYRTGSPHETYFALISLSSGFVANSFAIEVATQEAEGGAGADEDEGGVGGVLAAVGEGAGCTIDDGAGCDEDAAGAIGDETDGAEVVTAGSFAGVGGEGRSA